MSPEEEEPVPKQEAQLGIKLVRDTKRGELVPLLQWHSDYGYEDVDKDTLDDLVNFLKIPQSVIDNCTVEGMTEENQKILQLLVHRANLEGKIKPMIELIKVMRLRNKKALNKETSALRELWECDVLSDLVAKEDLEGYKQFILGAERSQKWAKEANKEVPDVVDKAYKNMLSKKEYAKAKLALEAAQKVQWVAEVQVGDDAKELIRKLAPPPPYKIAVVRNKGCFTVTRGRDYLRSYSWTLHRHPGLALKLSLIRLWEAWEGDTGFDTPKRYMSAIEKIKDDDPLAPRPVPGDP